MRRYVYLILCCLCTLGAWYLDHLWSTLEGQAIFRMPLVAGNDAYNALADVAKEVNSEWASVTLKEEEIGDVGSGLIYGCLSYHPEALGIILIKGSPLIQSQLTMGDPVALLNERCAMLIDPSLDCIGSAVSIGGRNYRIVGIYREYEPLMLLTRNSSLSAIVPVQASGDIQRLYVWLRTKSISMFTFQQVQKDFTAIIGTHDAGDFQSIDLDSISRLNRQSIRLALLIAMSFICWYGHIFMKSSRNEFRQRTKREFSLHYGIHACCRLIGPFMYGVLPSLIVFGGWISYLVLFAERLIINAQWVPTRMLDVEAWIAKLESSVLTSNMVESMPLYGSLLSNHMQNIYIAIAVIGLYTLWLFLRSFSRKDGAI